MNKIKGFIQKYHCTGRVSEKQMQKNPKKKQLGQAQCSEWRVKDDKKGGVAEKSVEV